MVADLGLNFTDALILIAVVGAALKTMADYRGWTRSPALVRQENADLRERNATLSAEVKQLQESDREKGEKLAALEAQVTELQKRDQGAVLAAISSHDAAIQLANELTHTLMREHEKNADARNNENARRHIEALVVWKEIRDILQPKGVEA